MNKPDTVSPLSNDDLPSVGAAARIEKEMARRAKRNAPLLAPITWAKESIYTDLIKGRRLYEGACDLSWPEYFAYRAEDPAGHTGKHKVEPLTDDDLAYAAQWTSCAVPKPEPAPIPDTVSPPISNSDAALRDIAERVRVITGAGRAVGIAALRADPAIIKAIVAVGCLLKEARDISLKTHGDWTRWLESECKYTERTAQRYIKAYKLSLAVDLTGVNMSIAALHTLAAVDNPSPNQIIAREHAIKHARTTRLTTTTLQLFMAGTYVVKTKEEKAALAARSANAAKEERIYRMVRVDLVTAFGLQALCDAAGTLQPEQVLAIIERLQQVHADLLRTTPRVPKGDFKPRPR